MLSPLKTISAIISGIATYLYIVYFNYEAMSIAENIVAQCIIFLPIIAASKKANSIVQLSILVLLGSAIGFVISNLVQNNNIWPIATLFWVALSLPVLAVFSVIGKKLMTI
jgi:hypothetical protein